MFVDDKLLKFKFGKKDSNSGDEDVLVNLPRYNYLVSLFNRKLFPLKDPTLRILLGTIYPLCLINE